MADLNDDSTPVLHDAQLLVLPVSHRQQVCCLLIVELQKTAKKLPLKSATLLLVSQFKLIHTEKSLTQA